MATETTPTSTYAGMMIHVVDRLKGVSADDKTRLRNAVAFEACMASLCRSQEMHNFTATESGLVQLARDGTLEKKVDGLIG
jgi:hypothetical protein